jgi:hypothetical protein
MRMLSTTRRALGSRVAAFGIVVTAWFFFLMFIAFFGGITNFQNYINNVFLWLLSGLVFALPVTAGRARDPDRVGAVQT